MPTKPAAAAPIVQMIGITKRFPGVLANDGVDLAIRPGEIHVLLGENGAGKSTLVGMLSGLLQPDEGEIRVDGRAQTIGSPRRALALGIGTVLQHVVMVPSLTVVENLVLGAPWWKSPGRADIASRVRQINASLGLAIDPDALTGDLSLGEQQQAEILRALLRGSRVLILDESTSMLTPKGAEDLGALLRQLTRRGLSVVFITHKLREAFACGDRISVLRGGRKVGEIAPERLKTMDETALTAEVVHLMFGAGIAPGAVAEDLAPAPARRRERGRVLLSVIDLVLDHGRDSPGLSLDVAEGEILGIAGIDGNGQKQLAEALSGQRPSSRGRTSLEGRSLEGLSVGARRKLGLRYVTDDRLGEGTVGSFPLATNLLLKQIGEAPFWKRGFEATARIAAHAQRLAEAFDIRSPSVDTPIARLSGGNIQKALLARELSGPARVVIYAKPTQGLDVQNSVATRRRIREAADGGVGTVLISTDLDELLELSHRIAVMADGRLVGTVANDSEARRRVGALMIGAS